MIGIVIPACNEESVLAHTITAILAEAGPLEMEVVVACNGCTDRTVEIAMAFGDPVRVVEAPQASKAAALNLGDQHVTGFPRFYIDADVEVGTDAIRQVADALRRGDVLVAAPRIRFDLEGRPWGVRAYYRIWKELPYFRDGMVGSGFYALSEEGRKRFDTFPDIIADDEFVRRLFTDRERRSIDSCEFVVQPPRDLTSIIRVKKRILAGNLQLHQRREAPPGDGGIRALLALVRRRPDLIVVTPVYLVASVVAALGARWDIRRGKSGTWHRDETGRRSQETTS